MEYKATAARLLGVTLDQIPHLKEVINNFANKLSLLKKSKFLPSHVCESFYVKVIQPSITYAMPVWAGVNQAELFKTLRGKTTLPCCKDHIWLSTGHANS